MWKRQANLWNQSPSRCKARAETARSGLPDKSAVAAYRRFASGEQRQKSYWKEKDADEDHPQRVARSPGELIALGTTDCRHGSLSYRGSQVPGSAFECPMFAMSDSRCLLNRRVAHRRFSNLRHLTYFFEFAGANSSFIQSSNAFRFCGRPRKLFTRSAPGSDPPGSSTI